MVISPKTWRLELADGLVVRDTSSAKRLDMAVARLGGEKLDGIAVNACSGMTIFYFDLGGRIVVLGPYANDDSNGELWSIHNDRRVVAVFVGGIYETGPVATSSPRTAPIQAGRSGFVIVARSARLRREIAATLNVAAV
jgi:hypothetical protein